MEKRITALIHFQPLKKYVFIIIFLVSGLPSIKAQTVIYVDQQATGTNDGSSWTNAYTDLQIAIDNASSAGGGQVWLKAGTYYPTTGTDRSIAFELKDNVQLYGGFSGSEISLSQRDWKTNTTTLSGEINTAGETDNSYNVIKADAANISNTVTIDGFVITGANDTGAPAQLNGGALFISGSFGGNRTIHIVNCTFHNNFAYARGAAIQASVQNTSGGNMYVTNSIFHDNAQLISCTGCGGVAISTRLPTTVQNCLFYDNATNTSGNDDIEGGAIYQIYGILNIVQSTFYNNYAKTSGGAVTVWGAGAHANIYNSIFWQNNASTDSEISAVNGATVTLSNNVVEGGYTGTNIYDTNPLFASTTSPYDLSLQACSPAINAGDNSFVPTELTIDFAGNPRIFESIVDLGAYEKQSSRVTIASTDVTDVTCNGEIDGSLTVNATGGVSPYEYSIDGVNFSSNSTFTGLSPGTYSLAVRDAGGCVAATSVTISEPTVLSVDNITSTDASCHGATDGEMILTVSGGTPPYSYSLDDITYQSSATFTGLAADNYAIYIKDSNECLISGSLTISEPDPLELQLKTSADATCNGGTDGSIDLKGNGGTAPYTYSIDSVTFQSSGLFESLEAGTHSFTIKDDNECTITNSFSISAPTEITATPSSTTTSTCGASDGSIEVTTSGGTAPYSYSLNGGTGQSSNLFTGLASGSYAIVITDDNGCQLSITTSVDDPVATSISLAVTGASCYGSGDGSITVTASGGASPYEYSIDGIVYQSSPTFSSIPADTYTIYVEDANNCIASESATVSQPDLLSLTSSVIDLSCNGENTGEISLTASGGTSPYQYSIDGINYQSASSFSSLSAGSYNIYAKDANNCVVTNSVTVDEPDMLGLTSSKTDISCNEADNGTITTQASGGTGTYEYSIDGTSFQSSGSFTGLESGNYTLTVKDANGCTTSSNITINEPTELITSATASGTSTCGGDDGAIGVSVSGGTSPYQYSLNGGSTQTSNTFSGLSAGAYSILVTDDNGCESTLSASISDPVTSQLSTTSTDISCNGASTGTITVSVTGGISPFEFSIDGSSFQSSNVFENLPAGTYSVSVKEGSSCIQQTPAITLNEPDPATTSITVNNISCNGVDDGELIPSASGGTPPWSWSLDGTNFQQSGFSNLSAATYDITFRDANGCETVVQKIISEPADLTFTAVSNTDVSCNAGSDGSFSYEGSGGTPPYEYSLDGNTFQSSPLFEGLVSGDYTLTIRDANSCTATIDHTVSEPAPLNGTINSTDASSCNTSDGAIEISLTGGTSPYTYSLNGGAPQSSNTFEMLTQGTYNITIQDANGCELTFTDMQIGSTSMTTSINITDVSCAGGASGILEISANGGTVPYEYSLDGTSFQDGSTFSSLAAGSYEITIRDSNGCLGTASAEIVEPSALTISVSQNLDDFTVTASGGTMPYEYSVDGINFQSASTFNDLASGNYTFTVKDANGCLANSEEYSFVLTASSRDESPDIFPNPVKVELKIEGIEFDHLILFDLNGKKILNSDNNRVEMKQLREGTYILYLYDKKGQTLHTQKIIKSL